MQLTGMKQLRSVCVEGEVSQVFVSFMTNGCEQRGILDNQ